MKIIHMSDLHLDSPFKGMGQKNSQLQSQFIQAPFIAFERGVELAIAEEVDVVLITGDIYNSERQTISAQHFFMTKMEELNAHQIPVFLIHGNHDYLKSHHQAIRYPENVHRFNREEVEFMDIELETGETLRVYGFSYTHQWITEDKVDEFPVNPQETTYTIGLLHGSLQGSEATANRYAPFTLQDLKSKRYDYWALGHIHLQGTLSDEPLIQYAGTTQGSHRNESDQKGCFILVFDNGRRISNTFYPLAKIVWQDETIFLEEEDQIKDIIESINDIMDNYLQDSSHKKQSYILNITLKNPEYLSQELLEQIQQGELLEAIDNKQKGDEFVLVNRIDIVLSPYHQIFEFDQVLKESYQTVLEDYEEEERDQEVLKELYNHATIQRFFDFETSTEFREEIIKMGQEFIIYSTGLTDEIEGDDDDHS